MSDSALRICFIGDSLVNGYRDEEFLGWTGRLCREEAKSGIEITCYNLGIRGNTSGDVLNRWESETSVRLKEGVETRLVFSFGINDCRIEDWKRGLSLQESIVNTTAIIGKASNNYSVLYISPPPVKDINLTESILELTGRISEICNNFNVGCFDLCSALMNDVSWKQHVADSDGYHPLSGGYAQIAETILKWDKWRSWF
jgi:lysophospholipase L1-like esterase